MKHIAFLLASLLCSNSAIGNVSEKVRAEFINAVENGDIGEVRRLEKSLSDLNQSSKYSHPPLHVAAFRGHIAIMQLLIDRGADPSFADPRRSETPLHMAVAGQQLGAVKFLLSRGVKLESETAGGGTPLSEACYDGNLSIAKALVEAGAKINAPLGRPWLPLAAASQQAKLDLVEYLIGKGADPNLVGAGGPPLIYAVLSEIEPVAKVRLLLDRGAKPDVPGLVLGWTAIQWAANEGKWSVVELLVKAGAELGQIDKNGRTLAVIAKEAGHFDLAERFLSKKSNR